MIKEKTYDIWASFKEVNFNDSDNLNITTNLLETEIQELYTDMSDISWNISDNGISSLISHDSGELYDLTTQKIDTNRIQVKFIPKDDSKKLERKLYFRIKEGHYGSVNSLLNSINEIAPKKHYDDRGTSGSISLKDFLVDYSLGDGNSSHDLITKHIIMILVYHLLIQLIGILLVTHRPSMLPYKIRRNRNDIHLYFMIVIL